MCVIWSWRTYDYLLGFIPSKLGVTGRVSWLRCVVHWAQRAPSEQFHCGKPKLHVLISFSLFIPKGLEQRNNIYSKKYFFLCLIKRTLFSSVCVLSLELFWRVFFYLFLYDLDLYDLDLHSGLFLFQEIKLFKLLKALDMLNWQLCICMLFAICLCF